MTGKSCIGAENQVVPARATYNKEGNAVRYGVIGERRKRSISLVVDSDVSDTYAAIHVEEHKPTKDLLMSMVEEMEDMVKDEIEEIEMEDLVVEPLPGIDSVDSENPLAVVELSAVLALIICHQADINDKLRAILVDWLIEVKSRFEGILYLLIHKIFLAKQSVVRKKLQLVGVTSLLLTCKYEEVSVPVVEDLILISNRAYRREQVLEMEKLIVNTLHFDMSVPTPYVFMRRTLKAAQSDKKVELLSFFMMELCLVEYQIKSCIGAENQVVPARRPITRRFADLLAGKSQACPQQGNAARYGVIGERHKRYISSVVDLDVSDTYTAIHVEEHKPAKDLPMSMVEEKEDMVYCFVCFSCKKAKGRLRQGWTRQFQE